MPPVHLDVHDRLFQRGRHLAIEIVEEHLREAEHRIHRRTQLVAHVGEKLRLRLARLRELFVQTSELGCSAALFPVETLELLAHVVHPVRESAELVAIGHADPSAEVARRYLIKEALRVAHGKDK